MNELLSMALVWALAAMVFFGVFLPLTDKDEEDTDDWDDDYK